MPNEFSDFELVRGPENPCETCKYSKWFGDDIKLGFCDLWPDFLRDTGNGKCIVANKDEIVQRIEAVQLYNNTSPESLPIVEELDEQLRNLSSNQVAVRYWIICNKLHVVVVYDAIVKEVLDL